MQSTIVIFLSNDTDKLSWVTQDVHGEMTLVSDAEQAMLADAARDKKVIVVVPAASVLLTKAMMPAMPKSRLMEALPYALEEHLITDVDNMHFAIGERQADGSLPVAVVAKEQLTAWLARLNECHITPHKMVSEVFALPYRPSEWQLALLDHVVVRTGMFDGFACDVVNADAFLESALKQAHQAPESFACCDYASNHEWKSRYMTHDAIDTKSRDDWFKESAAHVCNDESAINVLQGDYRAKHFSRLKKDKLHRTATAFLVAWLALLLLYPTVSYVMLAQQTHQLSATITSIYKKHFPHSGVVAAPQTKLADKYRQLSQASDDSPLVRLLTQIGAALAQTPPIELTQVTYQNNKMTIEFTAATSPDYVKFTGLLSASGLKVKEQSANLVGARIVATISVES